MIDSLSSGGTTLIRQRFEVPFEFPVVFTSDVFALDSSALIDVLTDREPSRRHRAVVVVDGGLETACPDLRKRIVAWFAHHSTRVELLGEPVRVPGGEAAKNDPAVVDRLHALFHAHHMDRQSFVIIVGGGGVLDAVGYAAATTHRGLRTVRLPTTVLAQNDSGVGVKNGINAFAAKNFLGTFVPPFAVVNDTAFLSFLPRREKLAGLAEAIKVSLVRDAAFFAWLESQAAALAACEPAVQAAMIRRCGELHLRHIATSGDPFELGSARPLDFGHWAAHKLESLTAHELRHGEAVALGVALDTRYSVEVGLLDAAEGERVYRLIAAIGLPRWHEALEKHRPDGTHEILDGLADFREHLGGDLTVTLLRGIGDGVEVHEMDQAKIQAALIWMRARSQEP